MLLKASPVTGDGAPETALRETMRVTKGRAPLLDGHLARLASGGAGPSVLTRVREAVSVQLQRPEAAAPYARLGVTVTPDGQVTAGLTAERSSLDIEHGPRIALVEVTGLPVLPEAAAKPAARRYWDRAHRAARALGAEQAVLATADGCLIDGSTATLWLVAEGELLTPVAPPAVAGVARELVFDVAVQLGIAARETTLTVDDLDSADEVFLSNAVGLVVPVRGRGGAVGERISGAVEEWFSRR
jgi:branched-subunit amino acid aminotransferase/4-amino-4-deoxychorismate lyase